MFSGQHFEIGFDISCKLSPMETICMKSQILLSAKNKKNINLCIFLESGKVKVVVFLQSGKVKVVVF